MDLEKFIRNTAARYRRYLTIYKILNFVAVALFLFLVSVFLNLGDLFKLIPFTEPYVGLALKIPLFTIRYEVIFVFFIICLATIVILNLFERNKKKIYEAFHRTAPKRETATDVVERNYPQLKDRLMAAYDNRKEENIIAVDLKTVVSKDIEVVSSGKLMDKRRIMYGTLSIVICFLFLVFIFYTGFTGPFSPDDLINRPDGISPMPPAVGEEDNNSSNGSAVGTPPISTDPGIDIDVTLPPGSGFGPGDLLENSSDGEFGPSQYYPPESLSSNHYYENLPPGYKDIIQEYFQKLAERS
ncbi:MAG: hypothetical protein FWH46_02605 [Methanimicrococcus sp.]|nr:hypothetical protein [Methanimicrococcus sp.]